MHTLMATTAQECPLTVDAHGRPAIETLALLSDRDAAAVARESVGALLFARISVVAAVSAPDNGGSRGVVTVREVTASGVAYRTSTAPGASGGEAVGRAVLRAFAAEESFVEAAAERWANQADVRSISVVRGDDCRHFGTTDDTLRHRRLVMTMPGPGTLAVDVVGAAHRVLRLPAVAVACTIAPKTRTAARFDDWMVDLRGRCQC